MKILLFGGWHLVQDLGSLYEKIKYKEPFFWSAFVMLSK